MPAGGYDGYELLPDPYGSLSTEANMTNQQSFSLSNTLNVDHLALVVDARKVIGMVFDLAVEAKRGLTPEECECLAAVNRLFDQCAEACLEHLYSSEKPESPTGSTPSTD